MNMRIPILLSALLALSAAASAQSACLDIFDPRPEGSEDYYLRVARDAYAVIDPADGRPGATLAIKGSLCHPDKSPADREPIQVYLYYDSRKEAQEFSPSSCKLSSECTIFREYELATNNQGYFRIVGAPVLGQGNNQARVAFGADLSSRYSLFNVALMSGPVMVPRHSGN